MVCHSHRRKDKNRHSHKPFSETVDKSSFLSQRQSKFTWAGPFLKLIFKGKSKPIYDG